MLEKLIVLVIVGVAAFFTIRTLSRQLKKKTEKCEGTCQCDNCPSLNFQENQIEENEMNKCVCDCQKEPSTKS
jgi:hypothetical protein